MTRPAHFHSRSRSGRRTAGYPARPGQHRTQRTCNCQVIESFHSTLEFELRSLEDFPTRSRARERVAAWIDEYNTIRRHSAIGMISPAAWEASQDGGQAA